MYVRRVDPSVLVFSLHHTDTHVGASCFPDGLIQGSNDVMVVCVAESRLEKSKQNNRKDNTENDTVRDTGVDDGGVKDRV